MHHKPALPLLDAIGDEAVLGLGVSERNLEHWRETGKIPGMYFGPIEALCMPKCIPCPRDAFRWKSHPNKNGNAPASRQGEAAE